MPREDRPAGPLEHRDIARLVRTIRDRVVRLLRKRGKWPDDDGPSAIVDVDDSPLSHLAAAAVQGRLAFGPHAGASPARIGRGTACDMPRERDRRALVADIDGFSLHAGVCIPDCSRNRLEKLARCALRPPLVHDRLSMSADGSHGGSGNRSSPRR